MILLLLVGLGLILGSFVNAFVWRLHEGRDWVRERSECTHCHHTLAPKDLIPVLSWLSLRGKCRYCHAKIHDNPLTEIAVPALFVISYLAWPLALTGAGLFQFVLWCIFIVGFVALAAYDFRWFLLPNKIVFPLIGLAIVQVAVVAVWTMNWKVLVAALLGTLVVAGIFYLLFQVSHGTWIGGGDVKLGVVLGLLAGGFLEGFLLLFVASLAALVATVPALLQGKAGRKSHVPFGPFLIIGLIVVVLFGHRIIAWYSGLIYV
ncbi:MAG TPA: prepilin peptidase [Candidatus Saccharimonadales bacterium]|nr:prepilin peptidase [Candidatus Saccharimonadales bacterium]